MKAALLLMLCAQVAFGGFNPYVLTSTGTNINTGTTTNATPTVEYTSGTWVAATGVFTPAVGNPISDGVVVGDRISIYTNGAPDWNLLANVTAVAATTFTVSLQNRAGSAPADSVGGMSARKGGSAYGWYGTNFHPFTTGPNIGAASWTWNSLGMLTNGLSNLCIYLKTDRIYEHIGTFSNNCPAVGVVRLEAFTNTPGDITALVTNWPIAWWRAATNVSFMFQAGWYWNAPGIDLNNIGFFEQATNASGAIHTNMFTIRASNRVTRCYFSNSWETALVLAGTGFVPVRECIVEAANLNQASGKAGIQIGCNAYIYGSKVIRSRSRPGDNGGNGIEIDTTSANFVMIDNTEVSGNWGVGIEQTQSSCSVVLKNLVVDLQTLEGVKFTATTGGKTNLNVLDIMSTPITRTLTGLKGPTGYADFPHWGPRVWDGLYFANTNVQLTNINAAYVINTNQLTALPYVDADNGDYNLNSTAGAGAVAKAFSTRPLPTSQRLSGNTLISRDAGVAQGPSTNSSGGTSVTNTIIITTGHR